MKFSFASRKMCIITTGNLYHHPGAGRAGRAEAESGEGLLAVTPTVVSTPRLFFHTPSRTRPLLITHSLTHSCDL